MKNILMLSIDGCGHYFNNELSEVEIKSIDNIAIQISNIKEIKHLSNEDKLKYFIKKVHDETSINLDVLTIKHIFRVNT